METLTQEQLHAAQQRFAEDGYVVLEGLIPLEQVERLKQALLSLEERHGFGYATTSFEGLRTIRINNLLAYDEAFWEVPLQPSVLALCEALLDRELLLSSLCSLTMGPGQTGSRCTRTPSSWRCPVRAPRWP